MTIPDLNTVDIPTESITRPILSRREFQVFYLIATGLSVNDIADRLDLSTQTVHTYRSRIKEKLNLDSNVQMALYAVKKGILEARDIEVYND